MKPNPAILAICVFALKAQSVPGDPLPGLSAENLQLFQSGRAEFVKEYRVTSSQGNPPIQRASTQSCSGCHQLSNGDLGGSGLIEGIPDEAILALQNRTEPLALGIRGRAAMVVDSVTGRLRVGRFGWKAQHATLLDASADSLARFIGVPEAVSRNEAPDSITGRRTIDRLAAYSRLLAPIGTMAAQGAPLFGGLGCANCHVPSITTLPPGSFNPASISPFSDFLLHDIGTAQSSEIRTTPLWGLRLRKFLLHDGSALTLTDAIRAHQGEATIVRQRFDALTEGERRALIEYLKTL